MIFKPDENPFLAEPEKQKEEKDDSLTGGASSLDHRAMTPIARLQENLINTQNIQDILKYPEQEYYRISFELKKVVEHNKKIPDWILQNNNVQLLSHLKNNELRQIVKEKVIDGAKSNNDNDVLKNLDKVFVVMPKANSKIVQYLQESSVLKSEIQKRIKDIKNGKYEHSMFSMRFENNATNIINDKNHDFSLYTTIASCDVHNVKYEADGTVSMIIVDYYDFAPNKNTIINNAYIQQINKHLINYANVIYLRIKI